MSSFSPSNPYDLEVAKTAGNINTVGVVLPGSPCEVLIWGTFGGATVKVQVSPDTTNGVDGTWIDKPGTTTTVATSLVLSIGSGNRMRLAITGGTSPSINSTASPC